VATSVATQALIPGTTGRHQMKWVPYLSSQDGSWRVQLEGFCPTRNRKVVGSNPTSGSKTAGQRAFLALLVAHWEQAVIPLVVVPPLARPPQFRHMRSLSFARRHQAPRGGQPSASNSGMRACSGACRSAASRATPASPM
jgi:hypothetical protein